MTVKKCFVVMKDSPIVDLAGYDRNVLIRTLLYCKDRDQLTQLIAQYVYLVNSTK